MVEVRQVLARAALSGSDEVERRLARDLLRGMTIRESARSVYRDPQARIRYRLGCESEARSQVMAAARRLASAARA